MDRRRIIKLALTGATGIFGSGTLRPTVAADIGLVLEGSLGDANALVDAIVAEPLPLDVDTVATYLWQDRELHLRLAGELGGAPREELEKFILPEAATLVELMDEYEISLVPAAAEVPLPTLEMPLPTLRPAFPIPSPHAPRAPDLSSFEDEFVDAVITALLTLLGYSEEEIAKVERPFRMVLSETPGAEEKLRELARAAWERYWWAVALVAAQLAAILFSAAFVIRFMRVLADQLGEAAAKALVRQLIKAASLRFVPFLGPVTLCYRLVLSAKIFVQRLRWRGARPGQGG